MTTEPTRNPYGKQTSDEKFEQITAHLETHRHIMLQSHAVFAEQLRLMRMALLLMAFAQGLMLVLLGKALLT